jgi:autoinducer 2-degrading protein
VPHPGVTYSRPARLNKPTTPHIRSAECTTECTILRVNSREATMHVTLVHVHASDLRMSMPSSPQRGSITSRRSAEPGNRRFDVLQAPDDPARFILYEAYASAADAAAHKETAHYLAWRDGRRRHDGRAASRRADERTPARMSNVFAPFRSPACRASNSAAAPRQAAGHRRRLRPPSAARHRRAFVCRIGSRGAAVRGVVRAASRGSRSGCPANRRRRSSMRPSPPCGQRA